MLREELFELFFQPGTDAVGEVGEVERGGRVLGQFKQPLLDAGVAVLQTEVEDCPLGRWELPEGVASGDAETDVERQPGLTDLWRAGEDVETLGSSLSTTNRREGSGVDIRASASMVNSVFIGTSM